MCAAYQKVHQNLRTPQTPHPHHEIIPTQERSIRYIQRGTEFIWSHLNDCVIPIKLSKLGENLAYYGHSIN